MHIRIITLGSLKEPYWKNAQDEYLKRLSPYADVTIDELPEEPFRIGDDRERIKHKEAEKILKHIPGHAVIIALDEHGKTFSSTDFAQWVDKTAMYGDTLVFILGGPLGLHESFLERAHHRIALSSLTFTHQMGRIILFEQLYRSVMINHGKQYHY